MAQSFPDRAAIEALQLSRLRELLQAVIPANPFYAQKFARQGATQGASGLDAFFLRAPMTTKQEVAADQLAHPPYGSNLTYPVERYTRMHQTSGTSGSPLRWLDTPESWNAMVDCWTEVYRAAGLTASDRILFAFSFGPFIGFWLAFEAGAKMGALCLPGGGLSSEARLRLLLTHGATVLCCTPTYALRLAEVAAQENIDLRQSKVRLIIVAGEPGGSIPATRKRLSELWNGARVFDHHGMTEVGPVTFQCEAQPGVLHVVESVYLPEIVDDVGRHVPPGQTGELALTTLMRTGSPLIRYHTGDLVKTFATTGKEPCKCGRWELALEGGILGRCDDMVVVRGVNVFPSAIEEIMRKAGGIVEYQVRVASRGAMTELNIQVEPTSETTDALQLVARLEKSFDAAFHLRIPVTLVAPGTLPRFELKAKRWVKEGV